MATFELVDGRPTAPVTLSARSRAGAEFTFAVAQDAVRVSPAWAADSSGDTMLAARRIVEGCDGRMSVTTTECGTEMVITMPTLS